MHYKRNNIVTGSTDLSRFIGHTENEVENLYSI